MSKTASFGTNLGKFVDHVVHQPGVISGAGLIALLASLDKIKKESKPQVINEPYQGIHANKSGSILKKMANSPLLKQANHFAKKATGLASGLAAAGAGIGGMIGGPEGAIIGGGIGGGAGLGISVAPWISSALIPNSRARLYNAFKGPIDAHTRRVNLKNFAKEKPNTTIDQTTFDSVKNAPRSIPTAYIRGTGNAYGSMYTDPTTWIAAGVGGGVGGIAGGIGAAYTKGGSVTNFFKQANPLANLQSTWSELDSSAKTMTGIGGILAAGSLLNNLNPDSSSTFNNLGTAAGLALGSYGLAGNRMDNILPTLTGLFAGKKEAPVPQPVAPVTTGPKPANFIKHDGSIDFLKAVRAQDQDIKNHINTMTPEQRQQMLANIQNFKPGFHHTLGAKALGINIDEQKQRFGKLLS